MLVSLRLEIEQAMVRNSRNYESRIGYLIWVRQSWCRGGETPALRVP